MDMDMKFGDQFNTAPLMLTQAHAHAHINNTHTASTQGEGRRWDGSKVQGARCRQARCGQVWEEGASKVEVTDGRSVAVQVYDVHAPLPQAQGRFDWVDYLTGC